MHCRKHKFIHWMIVAGLVGVLMACSILPGENEAPESATPTMPVATLPPDVEPTPYVCEASVVEQPYENGFMFWIGRTLEEKCELEHSFAPGSGEIWVAIFDESERSGEWLIFVDEWDEASEPELDPTLTPPADLMQPVRGFGRVWRELLTEAQRQKLGWATAIELPSTTEYRYEGSGFINMEGDFVPRPGRHVMRGLAGGIFVFDETSQTFQYTPPASNE
ncbi:MAG: hypothetical protein JXB30_03435 [Anaerolineae bacterium]|nr:hypothetical protein [Anaerolineae bacterium]